MRKTSEQKSRQRGQVDTKPSNQRRSRKSLKISTEHKIDHRQYMDAHPKFPHIRRASIQEQQEVPDSTQPNVQLLSTILQDKQLLKRSYLSRMKRLSYSKPFVITATLLVAILFVISVIVGSYQSQSNRVWNGIGGAYLINSAPNLPEHGDPHQLSTIPQNTDHPAPPVAATSAYLLDADTGTTLYAYHPFTHMPMLSTTKLMTAVLAVEQGNPDQKITVTSPVEHDISQLSSDSSLFGMKQGETYTLRELLYGALLVSGNDAAVAIADAIGGNTQHFVATMNQRAQQLGLYDTHYTNPDGLQDNGHFSSAHDLAMLGKYSLSLPLVQSISSTRQYRISATKEHPAHDLINGNQFLWWYPGANGGKPGWDGASNFIQVVSCIRNHHHLIGVTMHTNNWWTDMRDLMNWGFNSFRWISPHDVDLQHPIPYDSLWGGFMRDQQDTTIPTTDKGRYYVYTGFSISGSILGYFDHAGGLKKFGYPTSKPKSTSPPVTYQQFEHGTIQCNATTKQCTMS